MEQQDLTKEELLKEIAELRRRVTLLETSADNLKLVEKALEKSETRYKTLTEKSVVGVLVRPARSVSIERRAVGWQHLPWS